MTPEDYGAILLELVRQPIPVNNYRNKAGSGRSQTFGVVNRRCMPPDYSRHCWQRPYLYKLLLEFGKKFVTPAGIPFTSITVNQNYLASKHRDKGNVGPSYLVSFGPYTGGELQIFEGDLSGCHDVRTPMVTDFSKVYHAVLPFTGDRYSLVYYVAKNSAGLPAPSVESVDGKLVFKRGDEVVRGLPHPLKGRVKPPMRVIKCDAVVEFL
jgi:hypothetical protein